MLISNTSLLGQDFQRNFNFDVLLPDVQGTNISVQGQDVSPFVQNVSFGQYNMDDLNPLRHGVLQVHSAGLFSISTVSMDFICPSSSLVFDYFEGWRSLIYDSTNLYYFPKSNYVNGGTNSICKVTVYDTTGKANYQWDLINIFPKTFPALKFSYENNEIVKFSVEFSVDQILPNNSPSN